MSETRVSKLIPIEIVYNGLVCSEDCPQLQPIHGTASNAYTCVLDKSRIFRVAKTKQLMRTDACIALCDDTEQPEQPTTLQKRLTDPTECPLCGGIAKVSSITASIYSTATQIEYFCTEAGCMNMFGFTKEFK